MIILIIISVLLNVYLIWGVNTIIDGITHNNHYAVGKYFHFQSIYFEELSKFLQEGEQREDIWDKRSRSSHNASQFARGRLNRVDLPLFLGEDRRSLELYETVRKVSHKTNNIRNKPPFDLTMRGSERILELDKDKQEFLISFANKFNELDNYVDITSGGLDLDSEGDRLTVEEKEKIIKKGKELVNFYEEFVEEY